MDVWIDGWADEGMGGSKSCFMDCLHITAINKPELIQIFPANFTLFQSYQNVLQNNNGNRVFYVFVAD